ncbi:MAG: hypothetical protein ACXABY_11090 [Candidatus Thorarchaeota archaeon]|jgi:hypothetical protein
MDAKTVQRDLGRELSRIFDRDEVFSEWRSSAKARDWLRFGSGIYAPRPDIGVGPFNIYPGQNIREIDDAFDEHRDFFDSLKVEDSSLNRNPRCLIAIEIENSNPAKHMIGNILNASILGKVGIVTTFNEKFDKDATRVKRYLDGVRELGKTKLSVSNVVVLNYEELLTVILDVIRISSH